MGERKVLNKYYPPDFDPAKLPKGKHRKDNTMKVRMMLPMSIRCSTCGHYMYKGTKFNTTKEDVVGETYLGIQIFRFYLRCSTCAAEITMKTDPEHTDYSMEHGASRNFEPWREREKLSANEIAARDEEEKGNAMKALENRTLDSRREMDVMNALDEMTSLNARHERVDPAAALAAIRRGAEADAAAGQIELDEEDEAAVKQMLMQRAKLTRRLDDDDIAAAANTQAALNGAQHVAGAAEDDAGAPQTDAGPGAAPAHQSKPAAPKPVAKARPKVVVKARPKAAAAAAGGGGTDAGQHPNGAAGQHSNGAAAGNGAGAAQAAAASGPASLMQEPAAPLPEIGGLLGLGDYGSSSGSDQG